MPSSDVATIPTRLAIASRRSRISPQATLQVEVCPLATAFGDPACSVQTSPSWSPLGTAGALLSHTVTGLASEGLYTWRARALYAPGPLPPATLADAKPGPWFRWQARGSPGDIRTTVPEPGMVRLLMAGCVALGSMTRRRR